MKRLLIILLMIFNSCAYFEKSNNHLFVERCANLVQFNKCRCHDYDLFAAQRISKAVDRPLKYCENLVGFSAESWATLITPEIKLIRFGF